MKKLDQSVNINEEAKAIVDFINTTWSPITDLDHIVEIIKTKAIHDARALFDEYVVFEYAEDLREKRLAQISKFTDADYYDNVCHILDQICIKSSRLKREAQNIDGTWRFEDKVKPIVESLIQSYPELKSVKPLGWDALIKDYNSFDGQEDYDFKKYNNLFKGSETESATSYAFPTRVALPYVMYEDVEQGYSPEYVLVGSIYAHFVKIHEYVNSNNICAALDALGLPNTPEVVFNLNVRSENPLLKIMLELSSKPYTKEEYEAVLLRNKEYELLSPEEKEAIRIRNEENLNKTISAMLSNFNSDEEESKNKLKSENIRTMLRQEFGM